MMVHCTSRRPTGVVLPKNLNRSVFVMAFQTQALNHIEFAVVQILAMVAGWEVAPF